MKRDPRLRDLSEDHHHALVLARRLRRAAEGELGEAPSQEALWQEARRRFAVELEPHFEIEETLILPALSGAGEEALVERTLADHTRLRELIAAGAAVDAERLGAFGQRLDDHVRFEERILFPMVEKAVPASVLAAVARATRERDPGTQRAPAEDC